MYGWEFYDVEIIDKNTEQFIKYENYMSIEEAEEYIKRMIDTKSLDYNEKLVLVKRHYDNNRDLIDEEIIKEVDYEN
jgi:hypothetical protein